jgi:hypothetical protein
MLVAYLGWSIIWIAPLVAGQLAQEGKERLLGRFALCHPPLNKTLPLFFPQEHSDEGGSRATRGKRSLARKSIAVITGCTKMLAFN